MVRPNGPSDTVPAPPPKINTKTKVTTKTKPQTELYDFRVTVYDSVWDKFPSLRGGDKFGITAGIKATLDLKQSIQVRYMNDASKGRSIGVLKFIFVVEALERQRTVVYSGPGGNKHTFTSIYQLKRGVDGIVVSKPRTFETREDEHKPESILTVEAFKKKVDALLKEKVEDPKLVWWEQLKRKIVTLDKAWHDRNRAARQKSKDKHKKKKAAEKSGPAEPAAPEAPAEVSSAGKAAAEPGPAAHEAPVEVSSGKAAAAKPVPARPLSNEAASEKDDVGPGPTLKRQKLV
ncbi:hypothetical protein BDP27DRAFT_1376068 [Rhodocollybia butyracea]|uniref:Uncharacterized protein n=1 Tax=Rhodocollybia butyracea TaxID=206335 RepID=A0A9P5TVX2_9AGAR|nr:hypothetical protein BDP27DRAFT_1376068 [Rhodocollybia butyracea]